LAKKHDAEVKVIAFEKNRGYGAAIQEAWRRSDADYLGFLDGDGTCDPRFFSNLCSLMDAEKADVVLGCRMNKNSKMPLLRKFGNVIAVLKPSASAATSKSPGLVFPFAETRKMRCPSPLDSHLKSAKPVSAK
jgi:glycosyltransferase involved in cell wall biosynthesis